MYKLIALDCDGTLLNSRKEITVDVVAAIDAAKSSGFKIVLASARPFYRLRPFVEKLGLLSDNQYTIAFNGGLVVNNTESSILFSCGFLNDQIQELLLIGRKFGTTIFMYSKDGILSNVSDDEYKRRNSDVNYRVVDLFNLDLSDIEIYKIAYVNTPEDTQVLRGKLPKNLYDKYEISSSVPQFIEIVSKGITKSEALERIGNKLNINSTEMVAFGDQDNDIPMLNYVGLSMAMGNATDEVKRCSDYITMTNDENGVAHAIMTKILGDKV